MDSANDVTYKAEPVSRETDHLKPFDDMLEYLRAYAQENPEMAALTCLGIGFVLGWKLKPW